MTERQTNVFYCKLFYSDIDIKNVIIIREGVNEREAL